MKMIDQHVSKYLVEIEEEDRKEAQANSKHADLLQEKVQKLMKRKEEYSELLRKLQESKQNEVSLVDPDCRLMKIEAGLSLAITVRLQLMIRII
jgi:hypothetical protein